MSILTKTALANFRKNKSRNVLIGIAILLTSVLLTTVPTIFFGTFRLENAAVREIYPTYHVMFRNVSEETAGKLMKDDRFTDAGLREDPAYVVTTDPDIVCGMVAVDETACRLNRVELAKGNMPREKDEIVVSRDFLETMGMAGEIGDEISLSFQTEQGGELSLPKEQEFVITGFTVDSEEVKESGKYSAMVSERFARSLLPEGKHRFRFYGCLAGADGKSTEQITEELKAIGREYDVLETNIVPNTEMLGAIYTDSTAYFGFAIFMIVIVLAGILTIYSIYYVSMLGKVQEYGKLRAIGATRRQIRSLVFREGFAVAVFAVPSGVLLGTGLGVWILRRMIYQMISADNILTDTIKMILREGRISLVQPWILGLAAVTAFLTVYLSLLKPMKIAGKITAVEAIRYQGDQEKKKKKERKGYRELNIRKLTITNLKRNQRRTAITILTLGMTGIFFMTVATVLNCMNEKVMAEDEIRSDIHVSIDAWVGDMMHPEREIQNIQKNNPLTEERKEQILAMDGVEDLEVGWYAGAYLLNVEELKEDDGSDLYTGISGLNEEELKECEAYVQKGSVKDPKLSQGTGVILGDGYVTRNSDLTLGDTVELEILDGDRTIEKEFEIVAVVDTPQSLLGNSFGLPADVLQGFCETDLTDDSDIYVEKSKVKDVTEAVKSLVQEEEFLEMKTYEQAYEEAKNAIGLFVYAGYGALVIFGMIGILNLINTMINSVYARKKELGMLQAIGMSDRQMIRMLQMEGLFYTFGTLALSLGIGSLAGYGLFLKMKADGMFSIKYYEYPVVPAIVLTVVVLLVQLLITYLVNSNFKKQSLIDRVRFAE